MTSIKQTVNGFLIIDQVDSPSSGKAVLCFATLKTIDSTRKWHSARTLFTNRTELSSAASPAGGAPSIAPKGLSPVRSRWPPLLVRGS